VSCSNDCATIESYTIPLPESSSDNIPSCSWPNHSSDVVKWSPRGTIIQQLTTISYLTRYVNKNITVSQVTHDVTFSCCNIISHQWWSNLSWFMNEKLSIHCLKVHQIIVHDTTASKHHQVLAEKIILGSWLIACCKLTATLARQNMWRHNYVIDRNEYLISTLPKSTVPCRWRHSTPICLAQCLENSWI